MDEQRVRYRRHFIAGGHAMLDSRLWRTDFGALVREPCECTECDCTFRKVFIEHPRYDQRHYRVDVPPRRRSRRRVRPGHTVPARAA